MPTIAITGMHRCGTSTIARVLNLCGVDLGPVQQLAPTKPENPLGFWENLPLQRFGRHLLRELGGSWDAPPELPAGWENDASLDPWRERATAILTSAFGDPSDWNGNPRGWKDPQTALLLPFWRSVCNVDSVVVCIREPREVAVSLERRNRMPPDDAIGLWLTYINSALHAAPDAVIIDYGRLFIDLRRVAHCAADALQLPRPDARTLKAIDAFVRPTLRRSQPADQGLNTAIVRYRTLAARSC